MRPDFGVCRTRRWKIYDFCPWQCNLAGTKHGTQQKGKVMPHSNDIVSVLGSSPVALTGDSSLSPGLYQAQLKTSEIHHCMRQTHLVLVGSTFQL